MTYDLGSAEFNIGVNLAQLVTGIASAKGLVGGLETAFIGVGAAAAGLAAKAIGMAGDFQAQNEMLVTSAGEAQKNLAMIEAGVLNVSTATGTSTDQLEAAMYKIESSGQRGKDALVDLQAAAEGAKLENSNLADVANAEMTVMTDYASRHITAAQAVNDLVATVSHGRANIQDMSLAMATVLPTASAVGVSLSDASAALSVMTARGTDAASAATYLKQMLLALDAPTSKATSTLKEIGLTTADISNEMKISLPDTLQMIEDHLKAKFPEGSAAYVAALKDISGGSRTMQGVLQLTGDSLKTFEQDAKDVATAVKDGGDKIDGWAQIQGNFNLQMDKARSFVEALGIKIGTALLPEVGQLGTEIGQRVGPALTDFGTWLVGTGIPKLQEFGGWFGSTIVPGVETLATDVQQNLLPPLESLGQTVGMTINQFMDWANQSGALKGALSDVTGLLGTLATDTAAVVGWLDKGGPGVFALATGLTSVATAIGLIKIEEFGAGLFNAFQQMSQGNGLIANLASKVLPDLATALGWTKVAAQDVATAEEGAATQLTLWTGETVAGTTTMKTAIAGVAVETEATAAVVDAASLSMTAALGLATAGISILVGALVVGIASASSSIHQFSDQTQKVYDSLGNSADDLKAKQEAATLEASVQTTQTWGRAYDRNKQSANDAAAQQILDQQRIADAAAKAAQAATDEYNQWLQYYHDMGVDPTGRNFDQPPPTPPGTHGIGGHHPIPGHASGGYVPPGQWGTYGEDELVYGGSTGKHIVSAGETASMLGGGGSSGGHGPTHVHFHVGGAEFWSAVVPDMGAALVQHIQLAGGMRR